MNLSKHEDDTRFKEEGVQIKKEQELKLLHSCNMFKFSSTKHANRYPYNV
jgi:hypothetical protein